MYQFADIAFSEYAFRHPDLITQTRNPSGCLQLLHAMDFTARKIPPSSGYTPAAVLLPLFERHGQTMLLFTRRSESVRYHKGEIAFPGGQWDLSDSSLKDTVLRETFEEIGIPPDQIRILAELDDLITPYQFHVTPFIGWIQSPAIFQINSDETAEMIELPLTGFFNHEIYRYGFRYYQNSLYPIHSFYCRQYRIWGITGKILFNFLNALIVTHAQKK